jgi:hypothetical protein
MFGVRCGSDIYSTRPQQFTATILFTAQDRNYKGGASSSDIMLVQKLLVGQACGIIDHNHV